MFSIFKKNQIIFNKEAYHQLLLSLINKRKKFGIWKNRLYEKFLFIFY